MAEAQAPNGYDDDEAEATELLVAELLLNDGWQLLHAPAVDRYAQEGDNAPLVRAKEEANRMPDILALKSSRTVFAEVKYKGSGAEWIRKNNQYEHFIDKDAWEDYLDIQSVSGLTVWLLLYEADEYILQRQRIDDLSICGSWTVAEVKEHDGQKYGNEGWFIPQSDFMPLPLGKDRAPENFFGQDRLDVGGVSEPILPPDDYGSGDSQTDDNTDNSQSGLDAFIDD